MSKQEQSENDSFIVVDDGDLRKYCIELPNLIDDLNLSVYAFRLYVHYKRVAGANANGYCNQSTRTLAEKCGMGIASVSRSKEELVTKKLIKVKKGDQSKSESDIVTIVDILGRAGDSNE